MHSAEGIAAANTRKLEDSMHGKILQFATTNRAENTNLRHNWEAYRQIARNLFKGAELYCRHENWPDFINLGMKRITLQAWIAERKRE